MNVITRNPVTKRPFGEFQAEVLSILADNPTTPYYVATERLLGGRKAA